MGTNYYVVEQTCDNPAHVERLHIGKSSAGWEFGFRGYPDHDPPLTSWAEWRAYLYGKTVVDEDGKPVTPEYLTSCVTREGYNPSLGGPLRCHAAEYRSGTRHDPEGVDFTDEAFA